MDAVVIGVAVMGSLATALVIERVALKVFFRAMDAGRRARH